MMLDVEYPCFGSGEPARLSANAIRRLGADLRQRLFGHAARPFEPANLFRRTARLRVNGRPLRIVWDAEHAVHDEAGEPVLGVCEHDPEGPATVMISLNAELLGGRPEMLRSTAAHELGHAIFDMPAAVAKGAARAFRSGAIAVRDAAPIDWREWRADEFMGAFLAPRRQLARAFAREASAIGAAIRWKVIDEIPTPYVAANEAGWPAIDAIAGALAEEFGVTSAFIGVRLRKYGLVG
ncbi:MAG TPA: hypothetical protein VFA57_00385 [Pseudolabrys sp.]|nr:hypothetical protein [Pseudolabrys sp.]